MEREPATPATQAATASYPTPPVPLLPRTSAVLPDEVRRPVGARLLPATLLAQVSRETAPGPLPLEVEAACLTPGPPAGPASFTYGVETPAPGCDGGEARAQGAGATLGAHPRLPIAALGVRRPIAVERTLEVVATSSVVARLRPHAGRGHPIEVAGVTGLEGMVAPGGGVASNEPRLLVDAGATPVVERPNGLPDGAAVTGVPRGGQTGVPVARPILPRKGHPRFLPGPL